MVLLSHLKSSGAEIMGIWILPFCIGDRASNGFTTPLAILCLTKHWHPGLSMTQNFLSFLSWNRNWNGFSRIYFVSDSELHSRFVHCQHSPQMTKEYSRMDIYSSVSTVFEPSSRSEGPEIWWVGPPVGISGFPRRFRATGLRKWHHNLFFCFA